VTLESSNAQLLRWGAKLDSIKKLCIKKGPSKVFEALLDATTVKIIEAQRAIKESLVIDLGEGQSFRDIEKLVKVVQTLDSKVHELSNQITGQMRGQPMTTDRQSSCPTGKCECDERLEHRFDLLESRLISRLELSQSTQCNCEHQFDTKLKALESCILNVLTKASETVHEKQFTQFFLKFDKFNEHNRIDMLSIHH
jgi:hypothetical protein